MLRNHFNHFKRYPSIPSSASTLLLSPSLPFPLSLLLLLSLTPQSITDSWPPILSEIILQSASTFGFGGHQPYIDGASVDPGLRAVLMMSLAAGRRVRAAAQKPRISAVLRRRRRCRREREGPPRGLRVTRRQETASLLKSASDQF